jgi:hypothetical protein
MGSERCPDPDISWRLQSPEAKKKQENWRGKKFSLSVRGNTSNLASLSWVPVAWDILILNASFHVHKLQILTYGQEWPIHIFLAFTTYLRVSIP